MLYRVGVGGFLHKLSGPCKKETRPQFACIYPFDILQGWRDIRALRKSTEGIAFEI